MFTLISSEKWLTGLHHWHLYDFGAKSDVRRIFACWLCNCWFEMRARNNDSHTHTHTLAISDFPHDPTTLTVTDAEDWKQGTAHAVIFMELLQVRAPPAGVSQQCRDWGFDGSFRSEADFFLPPQSIVSTWMLITGMFSDTVALKMLCFFHFFWAESSIFFYLKNNK